MVDAEALAQLGPASGTSKCFSRDVAPRRSTMSRGGTPIVFARSFATASFAAPSAGGAVTRTPSRPASSKPVMASRLARGVTRTTSVGMG
ncbi:MAG: hypothetical protein U5Q44_10255 [Dehalococcoidia bacterium]|nr:hypothetical protein [Dehalococcoidia bacterium]